MRKGQLFNSQICETLSKMGHTDTITISDVGLPIHENTKRIDLALTSGIPSFIQTLNVILQDMQIEKATIASEIIDNNPSIYSQILEKLKLTEKIQRNIIEISYVSHEIFKQHTQECKAVIRTGECSPYANIILQSGVFF